jgi:inosine/xanthosine triphosphate pyrophosphatase family protein
MPTSFSGKTHGALIVPQQRDARGHIFAPIFMKLAHGSG